MLVMEKWTVKSIKKHLKYLDGVKSKHPKNVKNTRLFWENELKKRQKNGDNRNSTDNSND